VQFISLGGSILSAIQQEWAKLYLKHFVTQARRRSEEMIKKFVKPFEKYIED